MSGAPPGIEPGLLRRFRAAGAKIRWKEVERGRRAHLHDEESRIELRELPGGPQLWTDAGPVGALVILLEVDRRGPARFLAAVDAAAPRFPAGALVAGWGGALPPGGRSLPLEDLVAVARYALA